MRGFLTIVAILLSPLALADDFKALLLEHDRTRSFCSEYSHALLPIGVHGQPAPGQEVSMMPVHYGTAVAVQDNNRKTRLMTSAILANGGSIAFLVLPTGQRVAIEKKQTLGDGALVELHVDEGILPPTLQPLKLYGGTPIRNTMPIFTIANPTAQFPVLIRGAVLELLTGPLSGLLVNDIPAPHGTALLTATGHLVGINYRRFPKRDKHSIAVSAETIREWLHPKSPTVHSSASAR